jgi:hypothetical protein
MFRLPVTSRLEVWKKFRQSLNKLCVEDALEATVDFWNPCPFTPHYLDTDNVNSWPDPWTLIHENYYCDLAKALGIVYTLYLTEHKNSLEFEIRRYKDTKPGLIYNLVYLNSGKYVLNLIDGEVVNNTSIDKKLKLIRSWSSELNLHQY